MVEKDRVVMYNAPGTGAVPALVSKIHHDGTVNLFYLQDGIVIDALRVPRAKGAKDEPLTYYPVSIRFDDEDKEQEEQPGRGRPLSEVFKEDEDELPEGESPLSFVDPSSKHIDEEDEPGESPDDVPADESPDPGEEKAEG